MKNETLDAAILEAVRNGVGFRKDIVNKLVANGTFIEGAPDTNTQMVDNSLQRLRIAKRIHYASPVQGWKVLS